MIEMSIDIDFDERELLDVLADNYAAELQQGVIECPAEDCDSDVFDTEIWTTQSGGFEGAAVCRQCNERTELDLDDSQVKEAIRELEREFKKLERKF
jgi:hypothetical protein